MNKYATVEVDHDDLTREVWRFYILDFGVVLESWNYETRETRRHKFRSSQMDGTAWQRIDRRGNRCEKPVPPKSVTDKAINIFRQSIKMAE